MKKIFGLLTFILIGLVNFGYCEDVEDLIDYVGNFENKSINSSNYTSILKLSGTHDIKSVCFKSTNNTSSLFIGYSLNQGNPVRSFEYSNSNIFVCLDYYSDGYLMVKSSQGNQSIDGVVFVLSDLLSKPVPELTSQQCQSKYGLVDPSNIQTEIRVLENNNETTTYYLGYGKYATIDLNGNDYLQYPLNGNYTFVINSNSNNNGNCTGTINTGDIQWSALYINQIQHQSAPTINISIPDEFDWDYTVDSESFDLDVNGYNVDTEYIDGIIRTQNYKPTSEDFTNLVGMLAPYSKYLIFLVFIFIIWAWIKKPFKSKKL